MNRREIIQLITGVVVGLTAPLKWAFEKTSTTSTAIELIHSLDVQTGDLLVAFITQEGEAHIDWKVHDDFPDGWTRAESLPYDGPAGYTHVASFRGADSLEVH